MEYVLKTEALSKNYKKFKALDGLTMSIPKGAIYGFIGKNGSGKTTLIRLICGLQAPSAGEYYLYGVRSTDSKIYGIRKRVGAVVEVPSVYLGMSAEENLRQQCRILGLSSFDEVKDTLSLVGLAEAGSKAVRNFSLGMRQRLGIAVALIGNPDFLVLDEPINGLDPEGIVEVRELILKLNRERGITFLISSHILDELSKIATHFGFINKGKIIKELSSEELRLASRKCIRVKVNDTRALAPALDGLSAEYEIISECEADIFGALSVSELVHALDSQSCEVISLHERDESLESFYIGLVGGEGND